MRFQLIDRIVEIEPGRHARGRKAVASSEDFFADHFPGNPVMPGVLVLESLAQTAGALLAASSGFERFGLMTLVENAKFRAFVRPGDILETHVVIASADDSVARVEGTASVEGSVVAAARLSFVLVPIGTIVPAIYAEGWVHLLKGWLAGHGRTPGEPL